MNSRHTFYRTLIVIMTILGLYLLWRLGEVVIVLLSAIILASAIRPFVNQLHKVGVPRGLAVMLIYLSGIVSVGMLLAFSIPPLFSLIGELIQEGSLIRRLGATAWVWAAKMGYQDIGYNMYQRILMEWTQLGARVEVLARQEGPSILRTIGEVAGQVMLGLVVAFYWLTARDKFQNLLLSITPIRHRARTEMIFNDVERTLGDYVRGTGLLMLAIGGSSFIGLLLLRVPFALALGLLAGLFEALPLIGATLGALPAVLVAFTVSPTTGVLTIGLFVIIQFLENNILVPRIHEQSVGLNPLLVLIAVIAGSSLNGIVGALLAIPIAGALQVILRHLLLDPMIEEAKESHREQGIPVFDVDLQEQKRTIPSDEIIIARS